MNRILLFASVTAMFVVMSCSKSEDPAAAAPSLVGTWLQTTYAAAGCTDTSDNIPEVSCVDLGGCIDFIFTATTVRSNTSGPDNTENYTTSGTTLTIDGIHVYQFSVTATTLTLTRDYFVFGPACKEVRKFTRQ